MRWSYRFALSISIPLIVLLLILKNYVEDIWDQYRVGSYIKASWDNKFHAGIKESSYPHQGKPGDKVIVMAKLEKEDTSWVTEHLQEYVPVRRSRPPANCT